MAIVNAIKDFVDNLVTQNYTELPERIKVGLEKYLNDNELIIITLLDYRAIYRAPKFIDSNTYFNSWFILTDERIIIARNSSHFKRFRDIPLRDITQIFYELEQTEPKITITTPGNEDIIEFMKAGAAHCEDLDKKIDSAIESAKTRKAAINDDYISCSKCGSKVLSKSKYCSECGARLDAIV
ncbi:MAG: PH domain-containing protein [Thermodesulfobacteriota bacterium]